jgi:ketosteroid isomerase-like protein
MINRNKASTTNQNTDLVRKVYKSKPDAIVRLLTKDVKWRSAGVLGATIAEFQTTPEEVKLFFEGLKNSGHMGKFKPRKFISQGSTVVVLGHVELPDAPVGSLSCDWAHVYEVRGRKIAKFEEYLLGLVKK